MAQPKQVDLRWGELSPFIVDQRIRLHLPEDVRLKGKVLSVRDDGLVVDVKKTSNKEAYPKGQSLIPRAHVSLIGLGKRGVKYRAIFTTGGIVVGAGLVIATAAYGAGPLLTSDGRRRMETALPLLSGLGGALGYLMGNKLDRKFIPIKVIGDPPRGESPTDSSALE